VRSTDTDTATYSVCRVCGVCVLSLYEKNKFRKIEIIRFFFYINFTLIESLDFFTLRKNYFRGTTQKV
jgi:hypothetical protein